MLIPLRPGELPRLIPAVATGPQFSACSGNPRKVLQRLLIATIGGVGMWSVVVVLPSVQAEFGVARGGASIPYTATMMGFAAGSVFMGKLADRFGVVVPILLGGVMLCVGYVGAALSSSLWLFIVFQGIGIGFLGLLVFLSNPFNRIFPAPLDGNGLNPLLQDPGLAFHPPFL